MVHQDHGLREAEEAARQAGAAHRLPLGAQPSGGTHTAELPQLLCWLTTSHSAASLLIFVGYLEAAWKR